MIHVARAPEMVNWGCHFISENSCLTFQILASNYDVGKDTTRANGTDNVVKRKICGHFVPLYGRELEKKKREWMSIELFWK
jgi:hypothetical protein